MFRSVLGVALALALFPVGAAASAASATCTVDAPTGTNAVTGAIRQRWTELGGASGYLGLAVGDEATLDRARPATYQGFQGGEVWCTGSAGAMAFPRGAFTAEMYRLAGDGFTLGMPRTEIRRTPGGDADYVDFDLGGLYAPTQGTYPANGLHEVHGAIYGHWAELSFERGVLGLPMTDEHDTRSGTGRMSEFQRGSVYWTPAGGAHEVHGAIHYEYFWNLDEDRGPLGYPVTDETPTPETLGAFNHFERGSVYWSPATGAHEVYGAIYGRWASLNWEKGRLGFPVSGEYDVPGGRRSDFQGGSITWNARTGATTVT